MDTSVLEILEEEGLVSDQASYEEALDRVALVNRNLPVKLGRPTVLDNPEVLYKYYTAYMQDINSNPVQVKDWVGKDAKAIYKQHFRPPTWKGFEAYLFRNGVLTNLDRYRSNENGSYEAFSDICRAIEADMFDMKFTGAALNLWESRIIAKELHLAESIQVEGSIRPVLEGGRALPPD